MGTILAVGNIINAGSQRGQADGFELDVLKKASDFKDNSNRTMLQFVMQLLVKEDQGLVEEGQGLYERFALDCEVFKTNNTDIQAIERKVREVKNKHLEAKDAFEEIKKAGQDEDEFFRQLNQEYEREIDGELTAVDENFEA